MSGVKRAVRGTNMRVAKDDIVNNITSIIQFDETDKEHVVEPQHNSLVISMPIGNCFLKRILLDNRIAVNIMMLQKLKEMGLKK